MTLQVDYATAAVMSVAATVAAEWDVGPVESCAFLSRGFNDIYAVQAGGARYVLRLAVLRARGAPDMEDEAAFIDHLVAHGVPAAAVIRTRQGTASATMQMPEGNRPAMLFHRAEGRAPALDSEADARAQAVTLGLMHRAAATYAGSSRYTLNATHLLDRPLAAALTLRPDEDWGSAKLEAVVERLRIRLAAAAPNLSQTRCHGDCHGLNARIAPDGTAVFIDFDDGGRGFLAYDLGVFLWAQFSFGRSRPNVWHAFVEAYRITCPLSHADLDALELFAALRHVWLLGEYAGQRRRWGEETMPAAWLRREVDWLVDWERERLTGLFCGWWR